MHHKTHRTACIRRHHSFSSVVGSPVGAPDIYSWIETDGLGLANNATTAALADQSAAGHGLTGSGNLVYKTGVLNGMGVLDNTASGAFLTQATVALPSQTIVLLSKCITPVDTNDVLNNSATATRLRMATPGYDWYADSTSSVVPVGGSTLQAFDTIVIRVAPTPGPIIIRINGVQKVSFTPHPNWYGNQIMRVLASMSGQLAVFGRFSSDIGTARAIDVESYLHAKWQHY